MRASAGRPRPIRSSFWASDNRHSRLMLLNGERVLDMTERVAVIGLGYVGLPVALAFDSAFPGTVGFDVNQQKIERLRRGIDSTGEVTKATLTASSIRFTSEPCEL